MLPSGPGAGAASVRVTANADSDWVGGDAGPGASVALTVTDSLGGVKATATVTAGTDGRFFAGCGEAVW